MPVRDYRRRDPSTVSPEASLQEAAGRMDARDVGSLVVVDPDGHPVGMLTARDVALRVLRGRLCVASTRVREIMREPVVTVSGHAPLGVAIRLMRQSGLRCIPVVNEKSGELEGIVTADDVVQLVSGELCGAAEVIRSQFPADLPAGEASTSAERDE